MEIKGHLARVPVADIIPSEDNPREFSEKDESIKELAESIKGLGLLQPVLVREHPQKKGKFDLRAGARRLMAVKMNGEKDILAIIAVMTDQQALEVTVVENLQREDLKPLEEAKGIAILKSKGWEIEAIAAHIGKSASWVVRRAQLSNLSPKWLKEYNAKDSDVAWMSAAHLELVARLPESSQDEFFEGWHFQISEHMSIRDFNQLVAKFLRNLREAKWDLNDAALWKHAGACIECGKRSSAESMLFEDLYGKEKNDDFCLDPVCWRAKEKGFLEKKKQEALKKYSDVLLISKGHARQKTEELGEPVKADYQIERCKKTDAGAKQCLLVDGAKAGTTYWGRPASSSPAAGNKKSEGAVQSELQMEREQIAGEFAAAQTAMTWAREIHNSNDKDAKRMMIAASVHVLGGGGRMFNGSSFAWLRRTLFLDEDEFSIKETEDIYAHKNIKELTIAAGALGIYQATEGKLIVGKWDGYPFPPADILEMAAADFVISRDFLEAHRKANILQIGKEIGCEKIRQKKNEAIEDILNYGAPAGTLTAELIKAFGVGKEKGKKGKGKK